MDSGWQTAINKRGPKRLGAPQKRYAQSIRSLQSKVVARMDRCYPMHISLFIHSQLSNFPEMFVATYIGVT
jgi:hypothetical protein